MKEFKERYRHRFWVNKRWVIDVDASARHLPGEIARLKGKMSKLLLQDNLQCIQLRLVLSPSSSEASPLITRVHYEQDAKSEPPEKTMGSRGTVHSRMNRSGNRPLPP